MSFFLTMGTTKYQKVTILLLTFDFDVLFYRSYDSLMDSSKMVSNQVYYTKYIHVSCLH